jgi:uncharacterized protein YacL
VTVELVFRLIMMLILAALGWRLGDYLSTLFGSQYQPYYTQVIILIAALLGFLTAPSITVRPMKAVAKAIRQLPARYIMVGSIGLIIGLIISALLYLPLSQLPGAVGDLAPTLAAIVCGLLGILVMVWREKDIRNLLAGIRSPRSGGLRRDIVLLDTSVIIDGRIADICKTGFISGSMVVPRFVLDELQHVADSADVLRRNRGRRGLDILNKLQKDPSVPLEISDMDAPQVHGVDSKLVKLARDLECPIITNDYNLNRVAELRGVKVLNINELANAVKAIVLPGEMVEIKIIQEGKEPGQGVGYFDDGTMVVVEDGRRHIGETINVVATRVLQTVAGRMVFARPEEPFRAS